MFACVAVPTHMYMPSQRYSQFMEKDRVLNFAITNFLFKQQAEAEQDAPIDARTLSVMQTRIQKKVEAKQRQQAVRIAIVLVVVVTMMMICDVVVDDADDDGDDDAKRQVMNSTTMRRFEAFVGSWKYKTELMTSSTK